MDRLYFGTAGKPFSTPKDSTADAVRQVHELGLGCMEIEFVHGVQLGEQKAIAVAETATELGVKLSAHAPYYINLNAREPEKIRASQERIVQSARMASICGARSVVVHTAFFMKDTPEDAYLKIKRHLTETLDMIRESGIDITIRPEVMGKPSQFGNTEEILRLCSEVEGTAPCIDFAHIHAATGAFNTHKEFRSILERVKDVLGRSSLDDMHIHCSGIQYGASGEQKHLNFDEADFNYKDLMYALKESDVKGLLVCESKNLEVDALLLQKTYAAL